MAVTEANWADALMPGVRKTLLSSFQEANAGYIALFGKSKPPTRLQKIRWAAESMWVDELERRFNEKLAALKRGEAVALTEWERDHLESKLDYDPYDD